MSVNDKIINDIFLSKILKKNCYLIIKKNQKKIDLNLIYKPYFLTIKTQKKLNWNVKRKLNANLICKQLLLKLKKIKSNKINFLKCSIAKSKDKLQLIKIISKQESFSRFYLDNKIKKMDAIKIRVEWTKNYFKKKRGYKIIICRVKKNIAGFLLLDKKNKKFIIDILVVDKKYRRLGVAKSLINFVQKKILKKDSSFYTGVISNNKIAVKFYNKLNFFLKEYSYVYHVHKRE